MLNNVNQQVVISLRVQPKGEPEFTHEAKMFVPFNGMPRTGDLIEVGYDPSDRSRLALETDWRSNTGGGRLLIFRSPQVPAAAQPVGAGAGAGAPGAAAEESTAPARVIEQLERLNRLREEGALTESEFAVQKAKVLSGQDI